MTRTHDGLTLFELKPNKKISVGALRKLLPDIETTLFFGKVYKLDARKLGELLRILWNTPLVEALTNGGHSTELQDYLVGVVPDEVYAEITWDVEDAPDTELLGQLWEQAMVVVAKAISEVADKLVTTLHLLPSKEGSMVFQSMMVMNRNRPTIGAHKAAIKHAPVPDVAVVLDVSGSMSQQTIETIIADVVGLSWKANAHLLIVSNNTFHWEPGTYDVASVLSKAQYGGTHYETLAPMFNRDWGTVISIADYDSSNDAARYIRQNCKGRIGTLLDISLVNRPTHLGECLGQLAADVRPLLIAQGDLCGNSYGW